MKEETFDKIERTFGRLAFELWEQAVKKKWPIIEENLNNGYDKDAFEELEAIRVEDLTDEQELKLKLAISTALNFGSVIVSPINESDFIESSPEFTPAVMEIYLEHVKVNVRRYAVEQGRKALEDALSPDEEVILKGDIITESIETIVLAAGKKMVDMGANLTTSRLINFGALHQMKRKGVVRYRLQAIRDAVTSKICRRMHAKTFEVSVAYDHLAKVLRLTDPQDLRQADPWIPATPEALYFIENNDDFDDIAWMIPPFHPWCRTIVVPETIKLKPLSFTPTPNPFSSGVAIAANILDETPLPGATDLDP